MLEKPGAERVTTAALAVKLGVSEAALYRHFASKAQMFEGLIDFIEQSLLTLINQITEKEADAKAQVRLIATVVLQFAERNPGMARVMVGDALVFENDRLQVRINLFFDKLEAAIKQCLRDPASAQGSATPAGDAQVVASIMLAFLIGRLHRFVRSGFKRRPSEQLKISLNALSV